MPTYDRRCNACSKTVEVYERMSEDAPLACSDNECGGKSYRIISAHAVTADDIPGGIMIEHGICNPDGSPKRYDSKSAIYKAAKAKGLHVGAFMHGSPHGRTWV